MSFTFGSFSTEEAGAVATLLRLPSFAGLTVDTIEATGSDGLLLGGTTRSKATYEFDVITAPSATPLAAADARDALALALDPTRGLGDLAFDAAPGWKWRAIVAAPIEWERMSWWPGGYRFRGKAIFDALEAYGRAVADERWPYSSPGNRTVTRAKGNARSHPTIEIEGVLSAGQQVTITVGTLAVVVSGPLAVGQVLRLDYDRFDFARWNGSTKVASAIRAMSTLARAELWPHTATPFKVSTTGTVTRAELIANSRRQ